MEHVNRCLCEILHMRHIKSYRLTGGEWEAEEFIPSSAVHYSMHGHFTNWRPTWGNLLISAHLILMCDCQRLWSCCFASLLSLSPFSFFSSSFSLSSLSFSLLPFSRITVNEKGFLCQPALMWTSPLSQPHLSTLGKNIQTFSELNNLGQKRQK